MSGARSDARSPRNMRMLEVIAVVLLAVATVGSAWCAYQSSQWSGEEGRLARVSSDEQVEGARLFGLATQTIAYDTNVAALLAQAIVDEDEELADFYRDTLARNDFLPVLQRWRSDTEAGRPLTPLLEDEEYLEDQLQPYNDALQRAEAAAVESREAAQYADEFVLGTLLLAISLFFAGVTTTFRSRGVRIVLLAASGLTIAYTASQIAELPVL